MKSFRLLLSFLIISISPAAFGQRNISPDVHYQPNQKRTCGTSELPIDFETWVQSLQPPSGSRASYTLPVVIHVIHNGEAIGTGSNLSLAQLNSQITILNADFRKLNADISNLPSVWTGVAADCEINFCLAKVNPSGNVMAQPGINRINRNTAGFTAPPYTMNYTDNTIKPNTIWDPNQYLNIWCLSLGNNLLGYATFPNPTGSGLAGLSPPYGTATSDGIVVLNTAFGNTGTAAAPYNRGRTATHEIGHWLGLRHIWGDGNCATDYCADTPTQQTSNGGCPAFPKVSCNNGPNGDMHMNYMDYTNDACMYMFTNDQKARMQAIMANSPMRVALAASNKCNTPNALDAGISNVIAPTGSMCTTTIAPIVTLINYGSTTLTSVTITSNVDGGAPSIFNWTGSLITDASVNVTLPNITVTVGGHTFSASTSGPNGGVDSDNTNNSSISNFTVTSPPTGLALPFVQGFQGGTFVPAGWALQNPDANNTWTRVTTAGGFGNSTASARMDNFSGNVDLTGQSDFLITPAISFSSASAPLNMDFNVAYARWNATYHDSLIVSISTNCGSTWTRLYAKGNALLATAPDQNTAFVPTAAQWRAETINLNSYIGLSSVQFRFEAKSGWGNHLYLDDINLYFTGTPPVAGFTGTPTTLCAGQSVAYTDTSINSPTSWAWTFPGGTPGTSTAQNPTVVYNTSGTYNASLIVTNANGSNTVNKTNYITVNPTVVPSVTITRSPLGTICAGTSVTFTATPTNGGTTPVYQWKLNGVNVGTNSPTYTNATLANGNTVSCEMTSNAVCASPTTVTSNVITMTVTPTVTPSVSIAGSPSGTICAGTSVTFTATPTNGGTTPVYQWKLNGANVGTNSPTYTNATLANGNTVSCEMTSNAVCASPTSVTSNVITMTVTPTVTPSVSITRSPLGAICAGTSVTFTATPTNGGTTPVYQWKLNGVNVGTNSPTYTNATLANGNTVSCEMTSNAVCASPTSVTSNVITMTVTPTVTPSVSITRSPLGAICAGTSVTFTATPTNGGTTPVYQWKLNGANVGTNSPTYTNATLINGNTVSCEMTSNAVCASPTTVASNVITMTVTPTVTPSVSIAGSPSGTICAGTSVTFTATPTNGGTSPVYQWILNGANVGTNSPTYTNATLINGNTVSCEMTSNAVCASPATVTSNVITMSVSLTVAPSVSISMSPSGEICAGTNLTFTATPTNGGVNPGYQWKLNGANVGTNSINYSNSSLVSGDVIHCEITSSLTCSSPATASSNTITITISSSITPSVSISQTPAGSFCSGTTLSFTATPANGGSVPSYQWLLNGSNVGPNSSTYSSSMLNDGDVISCIMTSELSCASPTAATSNSITITVIPNVVPIVSIAASPSETICEGTAVTFTATSSNGGTNPIYQWKLNGINVGTNSATYFNSSLVNGNSISCEITSNAACASPTNVTSNTVTMSVTPTVVPSVNITASPSETICEGTSVTFTALASNGGAAPDYQWKLNGANVGTNSSTYTNSTLLNGDVLTCQMTSNATCANPQMATSNSISITVSPTAVPTVSIVASPTGTICEGTTVTFTASGINEGNTPIYQWKLNGNNVGSNSPIYTNATLSNGNTITCELTSNAACANPTTVFSNSISITVSPSVVPSLNISSSQTGVICNGTSVSFTASPVNQGASPLYQWTLNGTFVGTNSATYSNTSLSNGDVIVCQMTSDASCASPSTVTSNTITITASPNVVPSVNIVASPSSAVCFGTAVTFIATPTNGGATPVYQWKLNGVNVGTNAASYSNSTLTNGNIISCEIISNAPCASPTMANSNVISMSISNISLITTTFNASCFGSSNGNASVSANGGQAPYTFLWNDASSQTTNTASALTAGNYTVIVTDNNGCVQTSEVIITQPAPINLTVTSVSSKCGQNNGSATVLALGGTGIYTYLWNDPLNQSTSTANALAEGIYTVTVMDGNNCSKSTGVQIDNISTMELTVDISSVTCFGANNGSATVNVSGPGGITSPYSYLWNDSLSQTTPIASNLTAGTYKATVTDNGGCSQSISVIIHEPLALLNATTSVNTSCGDNKGEISLETSGGIAPYTYLWSNMQTTKQISQLLAGDYTVLTKDANNCSRTDAVLVSDSVTEDCLFIPNAFSPNGDGNHDLWVIGNSDIYSQISVEIYNRWGNKVYASDNYANDWDGIRNGEKLPGGVYFYTINLNNGQKPISGSLTLLH